MERVSQEYLRHELREAEALIEKGARYVHFKNPEQEYRIVGFAVREDTNEVCVIYEGQYGERIPFIRTLKNFTETVEHDGSTVPRFRRV